ncbi:MAG: sugar transporter permease, partial [Paenibacillus sp.]|nr:sugar transporter permease [Paenibacillus sp.]
MAHFKPGQGAASHALRLPVQILKDIVKNKYLYVMLAPVLAYFIIFQYIPMYGAIIAFKEFNPRLGIGGSDWAGLAH